MRVQEKPRHNSPAPKHPDRSQRRDLLVISHATEDNQFTRWLALQLARNGYRVWCDLTKLLGGESFWENIESLLRHRAAKFIYVLSRSSNQGAGRGFWKELDLADSEAKTNGITDFIIPVAVDDLPSKDYNIFLHSRHALQFHPHWSTGLESLLMKLDKNKVRRRRAFNPGSVTSWWRKWYRNPLAGVKKTPETYLSSWFVIEHLPKTLYVHDFTADSDKAGLFSGINWSRPAVVSGQRIVTFAPAIDVAPHSHADKTISSTQELMVADVLSGSATSSDIDGGELRRLLAWLLREVWDQWIRQQSVGIYHLANNTQCAFFLKPSNGDTLWAPLTAPDGSKAERGLTGFWTRPNKIEGGPRQKHFWHFGIQARPRLSPKPFYRVLTHVIFSDDGKTHWESKKRMHQARRRQCKSWYNDVWRDRLLAAMGKLAQEGASLITISVSSEEHLDISIRPMTFESPISFTVISKAKSADLDKDRVDQESAAEEEEEEEVEEEDRTEDGAPEGAR
jgi:TIR domain